MSKQAKAGMIGARKQGPAVTPAQRAYEPAPSNDRALRKLSTELTRVAGGRVTAEGVGSWRAPGDDRGQRADEVLVARSRDVLDRAVAEMVRRGYVLLGVKEQDDGEVWAWLAGVGAAAVAAVPAVERPAVARKTPTIRTTARRAPTTRKPRCLSRRRRIRSRRIGRAGRGKLRGLILSSRTSIRGLRAVRNSPTCIERTADSSLCSRQRLSARNGSPRDSFESAKLTAGEFNEP